MNETTKVTMLCFFEEEPGDLCSFDNPKSARDFAKGVYHGAAAYGCGSVEIYVCNPDGTISEVDGEEINSKRFELLTELFAKAAQP